MPEKQTKPPKKPKKTFTDYDKITAVSKWSLEIEALHTNLLSSSTKYMEAHKEQDKSLSAVGQKLVKLFAENTVSSKVASVGHHGWISELSTDRVGGQGAGSVLNGHPTLR